MDIPTRITIPLRPVELAEGGLVSRSQAKRIAKDLAQFREIIFDFTGVAEMQQGFADELFRVWRRAHPQALISFSGVNEDCRWMLKHVGSGSDP
jgi:hypothetical protein